MKKVVLKFSTIVLILAASLSSCQKEKPPKQTKSENHLILSESSNGWTNAANTDNPNDSVGYLHNLALVNIFDSIEFVNITSENIVDNITSFSNSHFSTTDVSNVTSQYNSSDLENFAAGFEESNFNYDSLINSTSISLTAKSNFTALIDTVYNSAKSNPLISYSNIKSLIVNWEHAVSNSSTISTDDKLILLRGASIFRYSIAAWNNASFPKIGDGGYVQIGWFKNIIGCIITATADGVAGLVGSSMGGPVGAVLVGGSASALTVAVLSEHGYF